MKNLKNKIIFCASVVALLCAGTLNVGAQETANVPATQPSFHAVELGVRFMPTFSSFEMKSSSGGKVSGQVTLGYGGGAFLGINFSEHVGIQGEILYFSISQKYKESNNAERSINLRYVNIPLLLSLNTGKSKPVNFNVVAGPQIGLSAGSSVHSSGGDGTTTAEGVLVVKKGDLGFAYGAGLDFCLNPSHTCRLGIGFRGVYGLLDISDNSRTTTTNSYYLLDRTHIKTYSAYIGLSILL